MSLRVESLADKNGSVVKEGDWIKIDEFRRDGFILVPEEICQVGVRKEIYVIRNRGAWVPPLTRFDSPNITKVDPP